MGRMYSGIRPRFPCLIVLRRYQSDKVSMDRVTVRYGNVAHIIKQPIGGGFLLVSPEGGIAVIDIGPRFLTALGMFKRKNHASDWALRDLSWKDLISVLITHFHPDHWSDFPALLSLFFKWNSKLSGKANFRMLTLLGSEQVVTHLRQIMKSFAKYKTNGRKQAFGRVYIVAPNGRPLVPGTKLGARINTFTLAGATWKVTKTKHMEVRNKCTGVGFLAKLDNGRTIGFTGDTAYSRAISSQYKNVDLLVLNVGDFQKKIGRFPDDQHMKLLGAKRFICNTKPKIVVLTEFNVMEAGKRLAAQKLLQTPGVKIFVGDVGLTIRLSDLHIRCDGCGKFVSSKTIRQRFILEDETGDCCVENFCPRCLRKLGKQIHGVL